MVASSAISSTKDLYHKNLTFEPKFIIYKKVTGYHALPRFGA